MRSSRGTPESQASASASTACCREAGPVASGTHTVGDAQQITVSIALSHPGIPSHSNTARPMPRGCPPDSGHAASRRAPMTWDRSNSYCTAYCRISLAGAVWTITGVFFPAASDTAGAAAGCCADGHGFRSAPPGSWRVPHHPACARTRARPVSGPPESRR